MLERLRREVCQLGLPAALVTHGRIVLLAGKQSRELRRQAEVAERKTPVQEGTRYQDESAHTSVLTSPSECQANECESQLWRVEPERG